MIRCGREIAKPIRTAPTTAKDAPDTNLDEELFLCAFLPPLRLQLPSVLVDHPSPVLAL